MLDVPRKSMPMRVVFNRPKLHHIAATTRLDLPEMRQGLGAVYAGLLLLQ